MIDFARPGIPEDVQARRRELARLGDEIARLSAHIQAATYRLLEMIRAFDDSQGWHEEGFRTCAGWLSWRTGIAPGAAREKVRVARALGDLPVLSAAFSRGALSYSVARAITRVATPETEADWVEMARHSTAAQMERLVSGWRTASRAADPEREKRRHADRALWVVPDADGSWRIRGRLDPEVGAALCRALGAAGEALHRREPASDEPAAARRADALGLVAEAALGMGLGTDAEEAPVVGRAERFQVVVHVSAETLRGAESEAGGEAEEDAPDEAPRIAGGPAVSAETARRLACDSGVVEMSHRPDGGVLDVGRRRRTVPTALRRALLQRDRGCRFPGCGARFCDAHHVRHWARGGRTRLDNLLLLCRHHHRRVHEEGWKVILEDDGEARFHRPDERLLPDVPKAPAVPLDPVAELERRGTDLGIGSRTATSRWTGERLDLDWAIAVLGQRWAPEGVSAETPAGRSSSVPFSGRVRAVVPRSADPLLHRANGTRAGARWRCTRRPGGAWPARIRSAPRAPEGPAPPPAGRPS